MAIREKAGMISKKIEEILIDQEKVESSEKEEPTPRKELVILVILKRRLNKRLFSLTL